MQIKMVVVALRTDHKRSTSKSINTRNLIFEK